MYNFYFRKCVKKCNIIELNYGNVCTVTPASHITILKEDKSVITKRR